MQPENTYIRSSTMENQEQDVQQENSERGGFEWLKTLLFLGLIFVIGFATIRVVGPVLFTDFVPQILGMNAEESDAIINPIEEPTEPMEEDGAKTDEAPIDDVSVDDGETAAEGATPTEGASGDTDGEQETVVEESEGDAAGKVEEESVEAPQTIEVETYEVQAGDTLTSIAESKGTTVEEILAVNEFLNPHYLQLGQKINIPK